MIKNLKVKKVVIMDFQEPYSPVSPTLSSGRSRRPGVTTVRLSAPNTTTDYSAYVTKVPSDADIVFFPTQKPGDAQTFAQQLVEQGKKAKVFGGDGSNDATQFKAAGLVRVELRPGHHGHPGRRDDHRRLEEGQPRQARGLLRPAELRRSADRDERDPPCVPAGPRLDHARRWCFQNIKKVKINNWILGGTFRWSTKSNDPLNAKFYIFQIQSNGSYKLVG